jgi:rhamnosyltransferase
MAAGILGVVVAYNTTDVLIENIRTYFSCLDKLVIVDNSDKPHTLYPLLQQNFPAVHYIKNERNEGIARALNQGASLANDGGFAWMLTMDQDSRFTEQAAQRLTETIHTPDAGVGLYTPVHINKDVAIRQFPVERQVIKKTMTSGNLVSMHAYNTVGGFEEKLFIDYVDHEFNFRLRKNGFKLIRINTSSLLHNLGDIKSYKYGFFSMKTTNHSAVRRYYITRNRFYVIFKYFGFAPKFFFKEIHQFWTDCLRILVLEKNKGQKFRAVAKGTWDWLLGRYGKLNS